MKLSFEEILNFASKRLSVKNGEEFFKWLVENFGIPGENKYNKVRAIADVICTCLEFNGYYRDLDPEDDFWDYEEIKAKVSMNI